MKTLISRIMFLFLLSCSAAWAGPTAQVAFGSTTVKLDSGFLAALESLDIAPSAILPGTLNARRGTLRFPIPGGALDLETLEGDIFHTGGLNLSSGATEVDLLNFVIETYSTPDPLTTDPRMPQLTGAASLNGDVLGRYPLFDLDFSEARVKESRFGRITIRDVIVTLSEAGALALNVAFAGGASVVPAGLEIGTAKVSTRVVGIQGDDEDEDSEDDDSEDD